MSGMADAAITGVVCLWTAIAYLAAVLMALFAWATWDQVRTGVITWTAHAERGCLLAAMIFASWVPIDVQRLVTALSADRAFGTMTTLITAWYFGRAWWKLHKDGPNNGRRRRRAKYALKRLGGRLVAVPAPSPVRG